MFEQLLGNATGIVWNYPVVGLCLFVGIFFTLRLGFIQFKSIPHAIALLRGKFDDPNEHGEITHFQALTTALSGTIGLGNIAGVAIAIATGGPGAIFWIWIIGLFGMAAKFAECTLGTQYRDEDPETGEVRGGPMYYITKGMGKKWKPMALFYATAMAFAAIGAASLFQSNQAASALAHYYSVPKEVTGMILFALSGIVIIGGIKRIATVTSKIVPLMCIVYVLGALAIVGMNIEKIPTVFSIILSDAFTGKAAAGGSLGAIIIIGIRRAIFSNEAGLGSASIAHAAVKTNYPVREGIVAALGPFIDTLVVCTATAAIIIMCGNFGSEMYTPVKGQTLPFNSQTIQTNSQNWQITNTNVPSPEKGTLQQYRSNGPALKYTSSASQSEPATMNLNWFKSGNVSDGIRFSYLRKQGDLSIALFDENKTPIASFVLFPDISEYKGQDPISKKQTQYFKIQGYDATPDQWHSVALLFTDEFKQLISGKDIRLQFLVKGQNGEWIIDRVQAISNVSGIALTTQSFDQFLSGFGSIFITFSVFFFAFSTIISWSYYGETAALYVFGRKALFPYKWLFIGCTYVGAVTKLSIVLNFADLMLGLMVIPNAIALIWLSKPLAKSTRKYFSDLKSGTFKPTVSGTDVDISVTKKTKTPA